ncbi:hypothetical protein E6O75_ATG02410 [Venturia nashicola]|uniref:Uncharacterized protein n=1 Tax=Venturia nashicola TaxID=86259 RepID=A0A4Z1P6X9_9PEZI|nr:hypothetical protein E6O75_ATG02410 [Venturia nashicola]
MALPPRLHDIHLVIPLNRVVDRMNSSSPGISTLSLAPISWPLGSTARIVSIMPLKGNRLLTPFEFFIIQYEMELLSQEKRSQKTPQYLLSFICCHSVIAPELKALRSAVLLEQGLGLRMAST